MIIQIILNALIGLQLNIFAFVMIMQDEQIKAKKKKAPGRKIQNWESATHANTSKLKIHLEIRSSCLGPCERVNSLMKVILHEKLN